IAHQVGIGAVRYDIVSKQPSKPITFEWEDALDFEGQSAPYVQYAHARAAGILAESGVDPDPEADPDRLTDPTETALLETLARFPWVIEESADELEPHAVATYARDLADAFNRFYRECPVLAEDVPDARRDARLALVVASKHALANALDVLGVAAPESM
ncbi:MAG: DALR anticodon-binding domain-containing protein, partial [Halanaeroarchaeum sp.]